MPITPRVLLNSSTPFEIFPFPFPPAQERVRLWDFARRAKQEREGVLGRGNRVAAGRVHHDHAAPRGRVHIDVVHADAGAPDHAQPRPGIHDGRRDFRLAAHDDAAELRDHFDQRRFAHSGVGGNVERAITRHLVDATLGNRIRDQNFRSRHPREC